MLHKGKSMLYISNETWVEILKPICLFLRKETRFFLKEGMIIPMVSMHTGLHTYLCSHSVNVYR